MIGGILYLCYLNNQHKKDKMVEKKQSRALPICKNSEVIAKSRLFKIEQMDLVFSNGQQRSYERLVNTIFGAVMILPIVDNETILLVKEYAAGTEKYELGFPKGLLEFGESIEQGANRELKEEIGFGARQFHTLKSLSSSPAYFGLMIDVVIAYDLYEEKLEGDEPEPIEVVPWPIAELDQLLLRDDFSEARSIAAIYLLKNHFSEQGGIHVK